MSSRCLAGVVDGVSPVPRVCRRCASCRLSAIDVRLPSTASAIDRVCPRPSVYKCLATHTASYHSLAYSVHACSPHLVSVRPPHSVPRAVPVDALPRQLPLPTCQLLLEDASRSAPNSCTRLPRTRCFARWQYASPTRCPPPYRKPPFVIRHASSCVHLAPYIHPSSTRTAPCDITPSIHPNQHPTTTYTAHPVLSRPSHLVPPTLNNMTA